MNKRVSVFVINYNGARTVLKTIESILRMEGVDIDIQIMDDYSGDGSLELIKRAYPNIPVHVQPHNTAKLNFLRNQAIGLASSPRLLITDNDILFDRRCLAELLAVMEHDVTIATCTPRLMYWNEPERIYTTGTRIHFLGAAVAGERDEIPTRIDPTPSLNSGGGILLMDREKALAAGGFDEDYEMGWGDDGEFYHRLMAQGLKCLYVPSALAYHATKPFDRMRDYRAVNQIFNRWQFILTHYASRTIILLLPAFTLYEAVQLCFMVFKRIPILYFKGSLMALKAAPMFLKKRRRIQRTKAVPDRELLCSGPIHVSPSLIGGSAVLKLGLKSLCDVFDMYWKAMRRFI